MKAGDKCSCRTQKTDSQKKHPSGTWKFQRLRKRVIDRDSGHCQRCRIKFGLMNFDDLQCHHIKSWRDHPELAYDEFNLVTVCRQCNLDLGNNNKLDFPLETPEEISYFL
ncbi:HNH endonuclease [Bacillus wiedmannii]|nr:HNH endonuclease [Bacillus wiedmannii]